MLKLASLFTDHAVLQRGRTLPVWGRCNPREIIEGTLSGVTVATQAGDDGHFMLRFPPLEAGGPHKLEVAAVNSGEKVSVRDLLVGEVWLASGQSNMEFHIRDLKKQEPARNPAGGLSPLLRTFTVPRSVGIAPRSGVEAAWQPQTPETVGDWSAVALFFARKLHRELNVPVGIIHSSWGGTRAESWLSREALSRNPDYRHRLAEYELAAGNPEFWHNLTPGELSADPAEFDRARQNRTKRLVEPAETNTGLEKGWADLNFDDSGWKKTELPSIWKKFGFTGNGILWFRREVEIPAAWAGKELELCLGAIDKHDVSYFNGVEVGRTGSGVDTTPWNQLRRYRIPAALVKAGRAVIAVRNHSFLYDGGLFGPVNAMTLAPAENAAEAIPLAGAWRHETELVYPAPQLAQRMGHGNPNSYSILYDNMIRPLIPYALRGAIWYQGESNGDAPWHYRRLMRDLITDWRYRWGQEDFPFLQVQLANYRQPIDYNGAAFWPFIREAQQGAALDTGNLTASAIDVGEECDIHPQKKAEVGERLALAALAQAYRRPGTGSGPVFRELAIEGNTLRLTFDQVGEGLTAHGPELLGFFVADADGIFHPAKAEIVENTVRVHSAKVPRPVMVRYAWSDNPERANLYNSAGLPASSFRSDTLPAPPLES